MSYYTTRTVGFAVSDQLLPASSLTTTFNNVREVEFSIREITDDQDLISSSRDQKRMVFLQEEANVRIVGDLITPYPLYLALGSLAVGTPNTITVGNTIPSICIGRQLSPVVSGEKGCEIVWGSKVESMEVRIESGGVAEFEISLLGKGATISTENINVTTNKTLEPIAFYDLSVYFNNTELPEVARISFTVDNSVERMFSVSTLSAYRAYAVREGGLSIEGRMEVGERALTHLERVLSRAGNNTLQLIISKTHGGALSSTLTFPNVLLLEFPERIRGIEPFTVEIPFRALPSTTDRALKIVASTLIY